MDFDVISDMVKRADGARKKLETYSQQDIDDIVKAIARTVYDNAEVLARMDIDETGMGVYADKVKKNKAKSLLLWHSLQGRKSVGVIDEDPLNGIIKLAKPMGVVGTVTPLINPVITPVCNAMFAAKACNSIIIAPHPYAKRCASYTVELINTRLKALGAPEDLIQAVEEPNPEKINELMQSVDIVVVSGGDETLKSAYSSGRPAYGAGDGNVQCIIDRDVDLRAAVEKIVAGRIFDNGIIASGEQMIIVHEDDFAKLVSELEAAGAYMVRDSEEVLKLRNTLFDDEGVLLREAAGQPAAILASMAGMAAGSGVKLLAVEITHTGAEDFFRRGKKCPVIGIMRYGTFSEAVEIAESNLEIEGIGHSAVIHSNNEEHILYAGEKLNVGRLLVNQICATMNGGSFFNGLAATTLHGCGTWGNNIISENFHYTHLMNITRISSVIEGAVQPSDEEIWA